MNTIKLLILIIFPISITLAQINIGGEPYSFRNQLEIKNIVKNNMSKIVLPQINIEKIKLEDKQDELDGIPPRFGYLFKVNLNLSNSGKWIELKNGDRLWRLEIHCPSAKSINLLYEKFWIPAGSNIYLYNISKKHYIGGFTNVNCRGSRENPQKFATGLVYGDNIILEYYEPFNVRGQGSIKVSGVIHGYRYINILSSIENMELLGKSGDCQVDINCSPEGDNWQDVKKSVALILVNGNRYCTGSLINNTEQNGLPYLLTADHCLGGWANNNHKYDAIDNNQNDGIDDTDLSHYSFYWNYESPDCNGSVNLSTLFG